MTTQLLKEHDLVFMSEAQLVERQVFLEKYVPQLFRRFIGTFIGSFTLVTGVTAGISHYLNMSITDQNFDKVMLVYCFAMLGVMVVTALAMARYGRFDHEMQQLVKVSELPVEAALKARWYIDSSDLAKRWRDQAVGVGRELRRFDVQKLEVLYKQEKGGKEELMRTHLVQSLHVV